MKKQKQTLHIQNKITRRLVHSLSRRSFLHPSSVIRSYSLGPLSSFRMSDMKSPQFLGIVRRIMFKHMSLRNYSTDIPPSTDKILSNVMAYKYNHSH